MKSKFPNATQAGSKFPSFIMAEELRFSCPAGQRGRRALLRGYMYTLHVRSTPNVKSRWQCTRRPECKASLRVSHDETEWTAVGNHSHLPDWGRVKAVRERKRLLDAARANPHIPPAVLTQGSIGRVDSETRIALPSEKTLKRSIQRVRREGQPELPRTMEELVAIPDQYASLNGEKFLQYDSKEEDEEGNHGRVLIFASAGGLRDLSGSKYWLGDGTFKSSPAIAAQLYTLHYTKFDSTLPAVYAVMEDRTRESYKVLFSAVKRLLPVDRRDGPKTFSVDFELAASNALSEVFPQAKPSFCFFHYSQSLWRKGQQTGLAAAYMRENNVDLRRDFHSCLALAFVPEEHVPAAFEKLRNVASDTLDGVIDLLEDTYVLGRRRGRGRTQPRYPIPTWNVFERTLQGVSRTNNEVEGWNRRFNTVVAKRHPNIFALVEALGNEELYVQGQRELVASGGKPQQKKKEYVENDARLQRLTQRFHEFLEEEDEEEENFDQGLLKYLKNVGHSARGRWTEV